FRSETDTEVVAHLIEECLAATPAGPEQLVTATMTAFRRLRGLNAIAVADVRTRQIAAAKSGSPLVLGWSDHGHLLASDFSALLEHTRRVTFAEDRQAVLLSRDRWRGFDADTGRAPAAASPSPAPRSFPTWATSSARARWWSRSPRAVRPSTSSTRCARPGSAAPASRPW